MKFKTVELYQLLELYKAGKLTEKQINEMLSRKFHTAMREIKEGLITADEAIQFLLGTCLQKG